MPICSNCGVEIEQEYESCPLCHTSLLEENQEENASGEERTAVIEQHEEKVRILFREIFGFISLAAAIVSFAVDFAYGLDIEWSRFPLTALAYLWLTVLVLGGLKRRVYLLVSVETGLTVGLLYLLDLFTPSVDWFLPLALPLTLVLGVLVLVAAGVILRFRLSILSGISAGLIVLGMYLICVELILNGYLGLPLQPSWSLITAAAVIPIIAFFVYFERRLKKQGSDLDKYFHV